MVGAGNDFTVEFRAAVPRSEIVMTETRGKQSGESVVPLRALSEAELIAGELEILQRDEQYERSLDALAAVVAEDGSA